MKPTTTNASTTTSLKEKPRVLSNEEIHKMDPYDYEEDCILRGVLELKLPPTR
jgi:hypothetical protein